MVQQAHRLLETLASQWPLHTCSAVSSCLLFNSVSPIPLSLRHAVELVILTVLNTEHRQLSTCLDFGQSYSLLCRIQASEISSPSSTPHTASFPRRHAQWATQTANNLRVTEGWSKSCRLIPFASNQRVRLKIPRAMAPDATEELHCTCCRFCTLEPAHTMA